MEQNPNEKDASNEMRKILKLLQTSEQKESKKKNTADARAPSRDRWVAAPEFLLLVLHRISTASR